MLKKNPLNKALYLMAACLLFLCSCSKERSDKPKVLVFSKTAGFHHASIPAGIAAIQKLGSENGFNVDTTTNAAFFNEDTLKQYSAVIFLSTTGDVLNNYQEADFERYIQAGGGFVGIHAATDTEYDWGWYGRLVGAYFNGHPKIQEAVLHVVDKENPATKHLPDPWKRTDEWYNFKQLNPENKVLLTIDESSYEGGTNGETHPMAWYKDYDGGRSFYTELGHTDESYQDPLYLKHILGGIQYAIGHNLAGEYGKVKTQRVPEENRFVKTPLSTGKFFEPTEMAILPDENILVAQRRGELMLYDPKAKDIKQVGALNVYYKTGVDGVNAEEGVLGLAADPNYKENNYIYLFYSPADTSVNRLSRFVYKNGKLDNSSEKVMLQFYSQRQICCHTGGSIAFGPGNLLYLSTGDNSTPFDEKNQAYASHGYAPLDDRPGHEQYDARRSASNSNDLRGKILRIKVNEDGTYSIPEGNLFAPNTPKTRPEIYTMGHRNPYRISVDQKNGVLYWGEVGPDAAADSLETRGPKGYDEVNRASKAGYFGWPLLIGNNYAYHEYNYATGTPGPAFDPAHPVNNSANNTGIKQLPPSQPAFIWYPYDDSPDFPQVGTGGRNAMAGPVYYTDMFPEETRYADYYNGKLFIYDWIRNWMKVVTMTPDGKLDKIEPFMPGTKLTGLIDMEVGPNGKLYLLEYGSGWFSQNDDSGLSRIDYLPGNRPPKIAELTVNKTSGKLPLIVTAKVNVSDPEKDKLHYIWQIDKTTKETSEPTLTYTFKDKGDHQISVKVLDEEKAAAESSVATVYAGNEQPKVDIVLQGNHSFYFGSNPVKYSVNVSDADGNVDQSNLYVSTDYISGRDLAGASMGHQVVSAEILGKNLMLSLDCKACHSITEKSIGPAYTQVAQRYQGNPQAYEHLTNKIIKGGSGVWGEANMPAHPNLSPADARQIVQWVMSLNNSEEARKSLPATGAITPKVDPKQRQNSVIKLAATYTDQGGDGVRPLSDSEVLYLRKSVLQPGDFNDAKGFAGKEVDGGHYSIFPAEEGWLLVNQIDLSGISGIQLNALSDGSKSRYQVEVRLGKPNGKKIGEGEMTFNKEGKVTTTIPLQQVAAGNLQDVYLVVRPMGAGEGNKPLLETVQFMPQANS
ncbi:ThuA domain-containing protein [Pontibacter sp. 172403-2]|uniref:ThuA domain-containing protein n=1 Tax=Pontibacter rufus TaxID=2791028 RepID=UPI0018AFA594|nr:ThuA domain-containing protein [Pontibacter sp. 172403-2]MBF9254208.1 ThuA domain-containing protein [Pontibacter sp. 172403-2]